jgi:hypothetical protein
VITAVCASGGCDFARLLLSLADAQTVVGTDRADPEQRLSDVCAGGETGISVMATYLMVTLAFLCGGTLGNTPAIA